MNFLYYPLVSIAVKCAILPLDGVMTLVLVGMVGPKKTDYQIKYNLKLGPISQRKDRWLKVAYVTVYCWFILFLIKPDEQKRCDFFRIQF